MFLAWSILAVAVAIYYHANKNHDSLMAMAERQENHQRMIQATQHELEKNFAREQAELFKRSQSASKPIHIVKPKPDPD